MIFGIAGINEKNRNYLLTKFPKGNKINYFGDIGFSYRNCFIKQVITDEGAGMCFTASLMDNRDRRYLETLHFPHLKSIPHFLQNSLHSGFMAFAVKNQEFILATDSKGLGRIYYSEDDGIVIFSDSFRMVWNANGKSFNPEDFASEITLILPFGGKTDFNGIHVLNMCGSAHISKVAGIYTVSASNVMVVESNTETRDYEAIKKYLTEAVHESNLFKEIKPVFDGSPQTLILPAICTLNAINYKIVSIFTDLEKSQSALKKLKLFPDSHQIRIETDKKFDINELFDLIDYSQPLALIHELAFWKIFGEYFDGESLILPFNAEIFSEGYNQGAGFRFKASMNTQHVVELQKYYMRGVPEFFSDEAKERIEFLLKPAIEKEFEIMPPVYEIGAKNLNDLIFSYRGMDAYFSPILNILNAKCYAYAPFTDYEKVNYILGIDEPLKPKGKFIQKLLFEAFPNINYKKLYKYSIFDLPRELNHQSFFQKKKVDTIFEKYKAKFYILHKDIVCSMIIDEKISGSQYFNRRKLQSIADKLQSKNEIHPCLDLLFSIALLNFSPGKT